MEHPICPLPYDNTATARSDESNDLAAICEQLERENQLLRSVLIARHRIPNHLSRLTQGTQGISSRAIDPEDRTKDRPLSIIISSA